MEERLPKPATKEDLLSQSNDFAISWSFMKKWANVGTEEEWERLVIEAQEISDKSQTSEFCRDLMKAVIKEIERRNSRK